jgi:hypothetical protein
MRKNVSAVTSSVGAAWPIHYAGYSQNRRRLAMLNILKTIGIMIGLAFVVIAFSGVKYIGPECNPTGVLGGGVTCDSNVDFMQ